MISTAFRKSGLPLPLSFQIWLVLFSLSLWLMDGLYHIFWGTSEHFYAQNFASRNSLQTVKRVFDLLRKAGIPASTTTRGLDHGVWGEWSGYTALSEWPWLTFVRLMCVQCPSWLCSAERRTSRLHRYPYLETAVPKAPSLLAKHSRHSGKSTFTRRSFPSPTPILIVTTLSSHSLHQRRERPPSRRRPSRPQPPRTRSLLQTTRRQRPYTSPFLHAIREKTVLPTSLSAREKGTIELLSHKDYKKAHPTPEHLTR